MNNETLFDSIRGTKAYMLAFLELQRHFKELKQFEGSEAMLNIGHVIVEACEQHYRAQSEPVGEIFNGNVIAGNGQYYLANLDNLPNGTKLFAHAMPKSEPPCKPVEIPWMVEGIRAITFRQFVEYGKTQCKELVNGMPWSFTFDGFPVTHENDSCYLICDHPRDLRFMPEDILIKYANDILDIADEKTTLRDYNFRNHASATPQPTTDISELVKGVKDLLSAIENGTWCYESSGSGDEGAYLGNAINPESDEVRNVEILITKHTVKA